MQIQFGLLENDKVELLQFYQDPGANNATWFKPTGEIVELSGRREVTSKNKTNQGSCYDIGEYVSRVGSMMKVLLVRLLREPLWSYSTIRPVQAPARSRKK